MPPRREAAALVVNAGAKEAAEALPAARDALRSAGLEVALAEAGNEPEGLVRSALDRGFRHVVVGGGDGTLGTAAGVLAPAGALLSVLPLGTANDFARSLRIPRDLAGAARVAAGGAEREVDVGRVGGRLFLNAASFGLSSALTRRLTGGLKRAAGPLAYPVAAAAEAPAHDPFHLVLEADGERHELAALQVVVGNGRYHGGGRMVAPAARLDDRHLDVYAIVASSDDRGDVEPDRLRDLWTLARFAMLLRRGRHLEHPRVLALRTARLTARTDPPLEIDADGELAGTTPVELSVAERRLRVTVPPPRDA